MWRRWWRDDAVHAERTVRGRGDGTIAPSRPAALSIEMHLNEVAPERTSDFTRASITDHVA